MKRTSVDDPGCPPASSSAPPPPSQFLLLLLTWCRRRPSLLAISAALASAGFTRYIVPSASSPPWFLLLLPWRSYCLLVVIALYLVCQRAVGFVWPQQRGREGGDRVGKNWWKKKGRQKRVEEEGEGNLGILRKIDEQNLTELMTMVNKGNILKI